MVDLSPALLAISGSIATPTEHGRTLPDPVDVIERAAVLEFGGGLSRWEADAISLTEYGLSPWEYFTIEQENNAVANGYGVKAHD
jgi:hypothetical protein